VTDRQADNANRYYSQRLYLFHISLTFSKMYQCYLCWLPFLNGALQQEQSAALSRAQLDHSTWLSIRATGPRSATRPFAKCDRHRETDKQRISVRSLCIQNTEDIIGLP